MEKIRTIKLYGELGQKFGREHRLAVKNPAEAIRALIALLPGFQAYLMQAKDNGITFSIFVGKDNIGKEELQYPPGDEAIRIAPMLIGAKRSGIFQTILGVALIVVGAMSWFSGPVSAALINAGVGMVLGGVVQLLSPQVKGLSSKDSSDNTSNYAFNGAINTQAQGNPVPVLYGRLIVGSAVISAGISANEGVYAPYDACNGYPTSSASAIAYRTDGSFCLVSGENETLPNANSSTGSYASSGSGGGGVSGEAMKFASAVIGA